MPHNREVALAAALAAITPSLASCDPVGREWDVMPYYSACGGTPCAEYRGPPESLSLEGLYAVHRLGMRGHPWRLQTGEFVRRGPAAAMFLKERLASTDEPLAVYSILDVFLRMQEAKVFDASDDKELIALIQKRASEAPKEWSLAFRDDSDQLELRERYPTGVSAGPGRLGEASKAESVRPLCRDCDQREWRAVAKGLSTEQLFQVQRYGWEAFSPPMVLDGEMASRGLEAVRFLKGRLRSGETGKAAWIVLSTLQLMDETGRYAVRNDQELLALIASVEAAATGEWKFAISTVASELRTGTPNPLTPKVRLGYRIA